MKKLLLEFRVYFYGGGFVLVVGCNDRVEVMFNISLFRFIVFLLMIICVDKNKELWGGGVFGYCCF